jgi:hypothetical protein
MSDAEELIKRMRAEKEKEKEKAGGPKAPAAAEDMAVKLIIMPHLRHQLTFFLVIAFIVFLAILSRDMAAGTPWMWTSLPIIGLGLMICLIPQTEKWEYKPWQTRARQYERHQLER